VISPARLQELLAILHSGSPMLQDQAREELRFNAGPELVEPLIGLLSLKRPGKSVWVVEVLAELGDRRALLPLLQLQSDLGLAAHNQKDAYSVEHDLPGRLAYAVESLSKRFIEQVTPEDIGYLLTMLQRARGRHTFLDIAGRAVEKLADANPTPELADVLPYFEGVWGIPLSFWRIRRKLKKALQSSLPIPAHTVTEQDGLPIPVHSLSED
jgi:HEAT repeat protein